MGGLAKSIVVGAVSGAASAGVGSVVNSLTNSICSATQTLTLTQIKLMLALPQAVMHGVAQGFIQGVSGGSFEQSFLTAAISSVVAGGYGMAAGNSANKAVGQVLFGTFAGGITAELSGGNFWQGAATGLTVSLLNYLAYSIESPKEFEQQANETSKEVSTSNSNDVKEGDVINLHTDDYFGALSEWAKQSKPGVGEVEIHAHGWRGGFGGMKTVKQIANLLYEKSPTWKSMVDGGMKVNIKLKLFSCNTGRGNNSIASQIKSAFPNVTVIAPTAYWVVRHYNSFFGGNIIVTGGFVQSPGTWRKF